MAKDILQKKSDPKEKETNEEHDKEEEAKSKRRRKRKRSKKDAGGEEETAAEIAKDSANEVGVTAVDDDDVKTRQVDRTVFVEGIPYTCKEEDVVQFFVEHGLAATEVEECRLPTWQDTGRLRGYGHVVLTTSSAHAKALAMSGKHLQSRYLTIQPAHAPKAVPLKSNTNNTPSKTIALHNLSYDASEDDIESVMHQYGTIVKGGVRVVRESSSFKAGGQPRSKGFAYVEYEELDSAQKAVQAAIVIRGRPCRVDYDHGRVRGSFRSANGRFWSSEFGPKRDEVKP
jgi:nucleolin